jgi:hypothetical protein
MPGDGKEIVVTLSQHEFNGLLIVMGYAAGAAFREDKRLAWSFLELANRVNRDNPHWTPYEIPEKYRVGG